MERTCKLHINKRTMITNKYILSAIPLALVFTGLVSANPLLSFIWNDNYVGTCKSHEDLVKTIPMMSSMDQIEDGGYELILSEEKMTPNMHHSAKTSQQSFLKLSSKKNSGYTGFFIRVSVNDGSDIVDLRKHVLVSTKNNMMKMANGNSEIDGSSPTCKPGVVGLSHLDNDPKYEVEALIEFPEEAMSMTVEVTVNKASSISPLGEWYFSSYHIVVANEDDFFALGSSPTEDGLITKGQSSKKQEGEHHNCKWWCQKIPLSWYTTNVDEISKCHDYKFSCGGCVECNNEGKL